MEGEIIFLIHPALTYRQEDVILDDIVIPDIAWFPHLQVYAAITVSVAAP
jgi:hypothetical protein